MGHPAVVLVAGPSFSAASLVGPCKLPTIWPASPQRALAPGSFVLIPAAQRPPTVECSSKDFNIFFTPAGFSRRLFGPGLFLLLKQALGCRRGRQSWLRRNLIWTSVAENSPGRKSWANPPNLSTAHGAQTLPPRLNTSEFVFKAKGTTNGRPFSRCTPQA